MPMSSSLARSSVSPLPVLLTALCLAALGIGCAEPSPTDPVRTGISAAKGGTGGGGTTSVTVTAANPSYGDQGTVSLDVQITGSGFDPSAKAQWILSGDTVPSPDIKVNRTTFVSSTQVTANIDIAQNAPIDSYNIAVLLSTGKKGIGNELFAVTQAQPLGFNGSGAGINDASQIVGTDGSGKAFFWDPATPGVHQTLGAGSAVGIDEAGLTISGRDDKSGMPLIWTRAPGGTWPAFPGHLPAQNGGKARGLASDPTTGLAKYIVGEISVPTGRNSFGPAPARWTRDLATGAWKLDTLPTVAGAPVGYVVRRVAINGEAAGWGVGPLGLIWRDATTPPTVMLPLPGHVQSEVRGIDPTGTYAVGWSHGPDNNSGHAVLWRRDPATGDWNPNPIDLRSPACADNGQAENVNRDGIIVGSDCGAAAWRVTSTGIDRLPLGGLGPNNLAAGVGSVASGTSPYGAGRAQNGDAIRWLIVFP